MATEDEMPTEPDLAAARREAWLAGWRNGFLTGVLAFFLATGALYSCTQHTDGHTPAEYRLSP